MSNDAGPSFLDKKTIIAMILVGACWMGWQAYMQKKYPNMYEKKTAGTEQAQQAAIPGTPESGTQAPVGEDSVAATQAKNDELGRTEVKPESLTEFQDDLMSFSISTKGMGLRDIILKKYTDRVGQPIKFTEVDGRLPFATHLTGHTEALDFTVQKVNETSYVGTAHYGNLTITKSLEINTQKYLITTKVGVNGTGTAFLGLTTYMTIPMVHHEKSSFFLPQFEKQDFLVITGGSDERLHITTKEPIEENFSKVSIAAVGDQYFTQAIVDRSDVIPDIKTRSSVEKAIAWTELNHASLGTSEGFNIKYEAFVGPKYLDLLESVDGDLADLIDYGFFSWLAKKILFFLKWFHELVGNWGVAIILLTIAVRLLVMPLYIMSYKSMNKMKAIQPQIQALRERFKDDPPRMNQELMTVMRENKVNPVGGCFPMLLQFPVFIALYQVLGQSIELYQMPFAGWIHDLSLKDPYYVFPVLMGIAMFVQQKITPTTLDPVQAKVLMFMPLLFVFFMLSVPSGLAVYMFVSALLGILQQLMFMNNDDPKLATAKK